jgi:2-keto-4-pentenoate hydratase/2-oxohepta-3-ene-1,7-dioic acid hydratase in catechol pathway
MRLIRYGEKGKEAPGLLKEDRIVDLRSHYPDIPDIGEAFFAGGWLEKVSKIDDPGRTMTPRLGCPVANPSKIICLGKNYAEHAHEGGFEKPERPLLFCKTPNTLNGPYDPILLPLSSGQIDWEVELAVIIGRTARRITQKEALSCVAGATILNDVSGREAQFSESQWFRGKSFDSFAPLGPAIVTPDEIGDLQNLELTSTVNGQVMQTGNTGDMIFKIAELIEYISRDISLMPGDIISTGTPAGVGIFRDPPVTLKPGDVVKCSIEKIGSIKNTCVATG